MREEYRRVKTIVEKGTPELVAYVLSANINRPAHSPGAAGDGVGDVSLTPRWESRSMPMRAVEVGRCYGLANMGLTLSMRG